MFGETHRGTGKCPKRTQKLSDVFGYGRVFSENPNTSKIKISRLLLGKRLAHAGILLANCFSSKKAIQTALKSEFQSRTMD